MLTKSFPGEVEDRLRRVRAHVEELRHAGRDEDAEAVGFVREVAEQALSENHQPAPPRELLTTGQAALALGISDQTVRNWVVAGRLPAVKRGVRTMIPRLAVVEEIERSRVRVISSSPAAAGQGSARESWGRELLEALPRPLVERLDALHDKLEEGHGLSSAEEAEMIQLERKMADAAADHLQAMIRHRRAGAA